MTEGYRKARDERRERGERRAVGERKTRDASGGEKAEKRKEMSPETVSSDEVVGVVVEGRRSSG